MIIDLHIHSKDGSDGNLTIEEIFREAKSLNLGLMSITDHDSIGCQERAVEQALAFGIRYITGVELNVTFPDPSRDGKTVSLDFLGYGYDISNRKLKEKLEKLRQHREWRAKEILKRINVKLDSQGLKLLTDEDMKRIQETVDGAFGRPHIANYLEKIGLVRDKQEAFDRYLVECNVDKYPLSLEDASTLIRDAGGRLVLAHPNHPKGTSLVKITTLLEEQTDIIEKYMLEHIDGIECWHSSHDAGTVKRYVEFTRNRGLLMTGGSDCHQIPVLMGSVDVPAYVASQFDKI